MIFSNLISEIYNEGSDEYFRSQSHSLAKEIIKDRYQSFLYKTKPETILDLGCGSGVFAIIAKEFGVERVVGIDISSEQIHLARKLAAKSGLIINYQVGDIAELGVDGQFDGLVSAFGFCYAETKAVLQKELLLASKHLRDGGHLFATICDPKHPVREQGPNYRVYLESSVLQDGSKLKCEFLYEGKVVVVDYKFYYSKETWTNLLTEAGFRDIIWDELNPTATNTILLASK